MSSNVNGDFLPPPSPIPPIPKKPRLFTPLGHGASRKYSPVPDFIAATSQLLYHTEPLSWYFRSNIHLGPVHRGLGRLFEEMTVRAQAPETEALISDFSQANMRPLVRQMEQELLWEANPLPREETAGFNDALTYLTTLLKKAYNEANSVSKPTPQFRAKNSRQSWEYYTQFLDNSYLAFLMVTQDEICKLFTNCGHSFSTVFYSRYMQVDPEVFPHEDTPRDFKVFEMSEYLDTRYNYEIFEDQVCGVCQMGPQLMKRGRYTQREPPFLLIQLCRFPADCEKIQQQVLINFSFRFFNQNYVLDSAVLHKGTIEDGHYFALVRETEHFWTLLDDSRVLKGLRNQFAQQMLDNWACILMYRLIGENKSQVDPEVMSELKRAYQGIDDNPQLDSSPRIVSQKRSIKPALLQPTTKQAVFEEDYDEGLQDLDQEIAQIRREMELTCDDYDMYSFLREHALQNLSLLPPGQPYCGLENGAMICYANAVLQMLFTCKDIRSYLLKHGQTGPIHQLLAELFALMEKEFYERVTPSINSRELFIEPFRVVRPAFSKGTMHDAQEFWTILMELVHQEANSPRNAIKPKESPVFISACEQWIHQRTFVDDSPLASLLMGQLESSLTCLTCGRLSRSWNAFWQLQLQLSSETNHDGQEMIRENTLSVSSCLAEFTMHETLRDDAAPKCSQCANTNQPCSKQLTICRVPRYLLIHLKRFLASGEKNHISVDTNVDLSISGVNFTLQAAVCHQGTESMGHYFTLIREQHNLWTKLDDTIIRRPMMDTSVEKMLSLYAYLLMYKSESSRCNEDN